MRHAVSSSGAGYSPSEVQASLEMFKAALQAKAVHIDALQQRLDDALSGQHAAAAATTDSDSSGLSPAAAAADGTGDPQAELALLRQQLAGAKARLAAEREQRSGIKAQLAAVKAELGGARQAQEQVGARSGVWACGHAGGLLLTRVPEDAVRAASACAPMAHRLLRPIGCRLLRHCRRWLTWRPRTRQWRPPSPS